MWLSQCFDVCELDEEMKVAIANNDETLKTDPFNDSALGNLITYYTFVHHAVEAYRYGAIAIAHSKCNHRISSTYYSWGHLEVYFKNFEKAIEWYERSIEASNFIRCEEAYHAMAGCYAHLKNYKAAERNFKLAIEIYLADEMPESYILLTPPRTEPLKPNFYWKDLGLVYCCMGRYQQAINCFEDYLEETPDDWYVLYAIGLCHHNMYDDLRAMGFYYKSLKLKPNQQPSIYNNLAAVAYNLQKDLPGAMALLEKGEEVFDEMEYYPGEKVEQMIQRNLAQLQRLLDSDDQREFYRGAFVQSLGFAIEWGTDNDEYDFMG